MQNKIDESFSFIHLPPQTLVQIFSFLDLSTIYKCFFLCKSLNNKLDQNLWKTLTLRDYLHNLIDHPLPEEDLILPQKESDIITTAESPQEAQKVIDNPFSDSTKELRERLASAHIELPENWKNYYKQCTKAFSLSGAWKGYYGSLEQELLEISQKGYLVYAKKTTGHTNIPAGKLTWRMRLNKSMTKGKGKVHLADPKFKNPRWRTAFIEIVNPNLILITWFDKKLGEEWIKITFAIVRFMKKGSPITGMSVKFEPLKFKK